MQVTVTMHGLLLQQNDWDRGTTVLCFLCISIGFATKSEGFLSTLKRDILREILNIKGFLTFIFFFLQGSFYSLTSGFYDLFLKRD